MTPAEMSALTLAEHRAFVKHMQAVFKAEQQAVERMGRGR